MADTPSSTPNDPAGESPEHSGGEKFAAQPGQHESSDPQSPGTGTEHGRHEMAGPAGYPQFEGPGAAQYGSEPVEPPPAVAPMPQAPPLNNRLRRTSRPTVRRGPVRRVPSPA